MPALSELQIEQVRSALTTGAVRLVDPLADVFGTEIDIDIESMRLCSQEDLSACLGLPASVSVHLIRQQCTGEFVVTASFLMLTAVAEALGSLCLAGEGDTIDDLELAAELEDVLTEVGNIIINGLLGELVGSLRRGVHFHLPTFHHGPLAELNHCWDGQDGPLCHVGLRLTVGHLDVRPRFLLGMQEEAWQLLCSAGAQTSLEAR